LLSFLSRRYQLTTRRLASIGNLDLSHVTNLRSLSIIRLSFLNTEPIAVDEPLSKIIRVLQKISSLCVTNISLEVWVDEWTNLSSLDWKKIADELNHHRFAQLQEVFIGITMYFGHCIESEGLIRGEMSSLDDRNIILNVISKCMLPLL
jgi:hypothetical protein